MQGVDGLGARGQACCGRVRPAGSVIRGPGPSSAAGRMNAVIGCLMLIGQGET